MSAPLADVEARALITGEIVIAFVPRHSLTEGDEFPIVAGRVVAAEDIDPAYQRWAGEPLPDGPWVGVVEVVHPAALLDPDSGRSRHVFTRPGEGDLVILRVYDGAGRPVLSDEAFDARVRSIEGALSR